MSRNVVIATAIAVIIGICAGYWLVKGERRAPVSAGEVNDPAKNGGVVNNPPTGVGQVNTGIPTGPSKIQTGK